LIDIFLSYFLNASSFYLSANKKALAKFVKCVSWNVASEAMLALDLIIKWAPMDVEDALELLGPSFKHPGVSVIKLSLRHSRS
jgi:phosphatidylinositol 3-kinase